MVTLANWAARPGGIMSGPLNLQEFQLRRPKSLSLNLTKRCSSRLEKTVARRMPAISRSVVDKSPVFEINTRCDVATTPKERSSVPSSTWKNEHNIRRTGPCLNR
jgi:hypothetical protein